MIEMEFDKLISFFTVEAGKNWLSPEVLSLFLFHNVRNLSKIEEKHLISSLVSFQFVFHIIFTKLFFFIFFYTFSLEM